MKGSIFINTVLAAFCFYLLLQLLFGFHGVHTMRQTRQYLTELEAHIDELEAIQQRLKEDVVALQVDPRRLEEEARRIGYYDPRDIVVRRSDGREEGESGFGRYLYSPVQIRGDLRALFRWLSLVFALLCVIFFSLLDSARERRDATED